MKPTQLASVLFVAAALAASAGAQNDRKAEAALQSALNKEYIDNNLEAAIKAYREVAESFKGNHRVAASALVRLGAVYEKWGNTDAWEVYKRIENEYADQPAALATAQDRLKKLMIANSSALAHERLAKLASGDWQSVTADGRYLLGGGVTGRIRDLATGEEWAFADDGNTGQLDTAIPSNDGKYVAYASFYSGANGDFWDLRIAPIGPKGATGKVLRHYAADTDSAYAKPFGWSLDRKEVFAMIDRKDGVVIGAISVATSSLRPIKSFAAPPWPANISLSPDGRYIAYDSPLKESPRNREIFILATGGPGEPAVVVQDPSWDGNPVWTPDGKAIAFTSNRSGRMSLWMLPITEGKASGAARLVRENNGEYVSMGIARDGAYFYRLPGGDQRDVITGTIDLATGAISAAKSLESSPGRNSNPSYSPDGRKLAYTSDRSVGGLSIVIRTLASGDESEVPTPFGDARPLAWFPDGRSILFSATDPVSGGRRFHRIDLETGEDLMKENIDGNAPIVSPDGKKIFYVRNEKGVLRLMAYDFGAQTEVELFRGQRTRMGNSRLALSPDGREIAFTLVQRNAPTPADPGGQTTEPLALRIMSSNGGPARKLRIPDAVELTALQWSSDGKKVLAQKGNGSLWWVSADGGEPTSIEIEGPSWPGAGRIPVIDSIRPDGKEIAIEMIDTGPEGEVWVDPDLLRPAANPRESQSGIYVAEWDPATGKILPPVQFLVNGLLGEACAPSWSPDGKSVAFFRHKAPPIDNSGNYEWVIRSIESGQEQRFGTIRSDCAVSSAWLHRSDALFVRSSFLEAEGGRIIERLDLGSGRRPFDQVSAYKSATALSLDDKTLYMTAHDPKTKLTSIVALDLATRAQELIWRSTFPSDPEDMVPLRLALSPDGRTFALVLTDSRKFHLIRVGVDGAFKEIYTADATSGFTPSRSGLAWTKDGRSLLFMNEGKSEQRLMRISADGGKPDFTGLTIGSADAILDLSPDGRRIVFFSPGAPVITANSGAGGKR